MTPTIVAALLVVFLLVLFFVGRAAATAPKDGFGRSPPSPEAIEATGQMKTLFDKKGEGLDYQDFRKALKKADPVLYARGKRLYKEGKLTPDRVEEFV